MINRGWRVAIALLLLVVGCDSGGDSDGASDTAGEDVVSVDDATPDPGTGDWYRPADDATWQWQLGGTINTSYEVDIYDIDLFETPADTIAGLQGRGVKVLCYFSAGSAENWRADYGDYDAAVLGKALEGWEGEVWVDVRSDNVRGILAARLDVAVAKGCDGVEPDNVDGWANDTGFPLTKTDQVDFDRWLADEAHRRGLFIALKNAGEIATSVEPWFDLSLNEECHAFDECAELAAFPAAGKPILNAEYAETEAKAQAMATTVCPLANAARTRTLILPLALDDSFRVTCF